MMRVTPTNIRLKLMRAGRMRKQEAWPFISSSPGGAPQRHGGEVRGARKSPRPVARVLGLRLFVFEDATWRGEALALSCRRARTLSPALAARK